MNTEEKYQPVQPQDVDETCEAESQMEDGKWIPLQARDVERIHNGDFKGYKFRRPVPPSEREHECPNCGRQVPIEAGRLAEHDRTIGIATSRCPGSNRLVPVASEGGEVGEKDTKCTCVDGLLGSRTNCPVHGFGSPNDPRGPQPPESASNSLTSPNPEASQP